MFNVQLGRLFDLWPIALIVNCQLSIINSLKPTAFSLQPKAYNLFKSLPWSPIELL